MEQTTVADEFVYKVRTSKTKEKLKELIQQATNVTRHLQANVYRRRELWKKDKAAIKVRGVV